MNLFSLDHNLSVVATLALVVMVVISVVLVTGIIKPEGML
jgi:hypothetical protein